MQTLTALDLAVIQDTMAKSLSIQGGGFFSFTEKARQGVMEKILHIMNETELPVFPKRKDSSQEGDNG